MILVIGLVVVLLGMPAGGAADVDSVDTLFLRDGSILQGIVVKDSHGKHHVYNSLYGEIAVDDQDVLYVLPKEEDTPFLTETHVVVGETLDVISTFFRDIPEAKPETEQFHLLIPGRIDSVYEEGDGVVPFETRPIGDFSLMAVRFADIQSSSHRLLITSRQQGMLELTDSDGVRFGVKQVLDEEGRIRMILEHPRYWQVDSISPEPVHRFEGLIVWEKSLKRQQRFTPTVTFRLESGSSSD